jgi:ankyrin repeat protein
MHADETPLHSAAYYGDLEMVQVLLDYGVDVNAQARAGSTPLNFVINRLNDHRVVRLLLDHGADPNIPTKDGSTPLHRASGRGVIEVIHPLVEYGASVEAQDDEGRTPLDVASGEQREEIIASAAKHTSTKGERPRQTNTNCICKNQ